jgi:hypothetical protein
MERDVMIMRALLLKQGLEQLWAITRSQYPIKERVGHCNPGMSQGSAGKTGLFSFSATSQLKRRDSDFNMFPGLVVIRMDQGPKDYTCFSMRFC